VFSCQVQIKLEKLILDLLAQVAKPCPFSLDRCHLIVVMEIAIVN